MYADGSNAGSSNATKQEEQKNDKSVNDDAPKDAAIEAPNDASGPAMAADAPHPGANTRSRSPVNGAESSTPQAGSDASEGEATKRSATSVTPESTRKSSTNSTSSNGIYVLPLVGDLKTDAKVKVKEESKESEDLEAVDPSEAAQKGFFKSSGHGSLSEVVSRIGRPTESVKTDSFGSASGSNPSVDKQGPARSSAARSSSAGKAQASTPDELEAEPASASSTAAGKQDLSPDARKFALEIYRELEGYISLERLESLAAEGTLQQVPRNDQNCLTSVGTIAHLTGSCKPCAYWFKRICKYNVCCHFCHVVHVGQKSKRLRPSKHARQRIKQWESEQQSPPWWLNGAEPVAGPSVARDRSSEDNDDEHGDAAGEQMPTHAVHEDIAIMEL